MSKLLPYPKFKDSGVPWIGEVPQLWDVVRLRYLARIETGGRDTVDSQVDGSYPFFVRSQTVEAIDTFSYDCEAVLTAGDGAGVGKVFHHFTGKFEAHQRVYVLHAFRRISGRFFYYYFQNLFSKVALDGGAKSTVDSLRRPMLADFPVTVPTAPEQKAIVAFLDRETTQIDYLITKQERLIELLAEKRQAIITHAVTKGLDPTAPTKPAGVPWQGSIPEHWSVRPLKNLMRMQTGVTLGKDFAQDATETFAYLRVANVQIGYVDLSHVKIIDLPPEVAASSMLRPGDVLMTEGGDRDKLGRGCIWDGSISPCVHQNHIFAVRTRPQLLSSFLVLVLDADPARTYFYLTGKQSTNLASTNSTTVKNFRFGLPPISEQSRIVEYLSVKTHQIDVLADKARAVAAVLRERRSALISAAVTGKIKVTNEGVAA